MKTDYILYSVLALLIIELSFSIWGLVAEDNPIVPTSSKVIATKYPTVTSGDTSEGNVQIGLTPKGDVDGKFVIEFFANTHSVSLDQYDLGKITSLVYNGKQYKPISASSLDGHHSSGKLEFNIEDTPRSFKIIIESIPNVQVRHFEWGLSQ